jgi:hypothetical protein
VGPPPFPPSVDASSSLPDPKPKVKEDMMMESSSSLLEPPSANEAYARRFNTWRGFLRFRRSQRNLKEEQEEEEHAPSAPPPPNFGGFL